MINLKKVVATFGIGKRAIAPIATPFN